MSTSNELTDGIDDNSFGPVVLASICSVMLALYFYYVQGAKQRGQFVGFWPVTLLALASSFRLDEIPELLAASA